MNLISWSLAMAILLLLLLEAFNFQHTLVCRQKAWLRAVELKTRVLLEDPKESETGAIPSCKILVMRDKSGIRWKKITHLESSAFVLSIGGKL